MAEPYLIEITQGETLAREFRLVDDDGDPVDVTSASKSAKCASLSVSDFGFGISAETGVFPLTADGLATLNWPPGVHMVQVWFDWGSLVALRYERIFDIKLAVRKALS